MFRIIALAVLLVACSQDNPVVVPDEDLVGSWTVESTDLYEAMLTGLERYLKDEFPNADQDAINDYVEETRQGLGDPMEDFPFTTIRSIGTDPTKTITAALALGMWTEIR